MLETLGERSGIDHVRRERDTLRSENERLNFALTYAVDEAKRLKAEAERLRRDYKCDVVLSDNGNQWREQAEKLAVALEYVAFDDYDQMDESTEYERRRRESKKALADFNKFKNTVEARAPRV